MDADHVGAELGELRQHIAMDALADRGQQDHRGNADGNPEQGQETAQALGSDRAQGQGEEIGKHHGQCFIRACTGSSLAARRAGMMPNSIPVQSAVPSAAITAQSGG